MISQVDQTDQQKSPALTPLVKMLIAVSVFVALAIMAYLAVSHKGKPTPKHVARPVIALMFFDKSGSMLKAPTTTGPTAQQLGMGFIDDAIDSILPVTEVYAYGFCRPSAVQSIWHGTPIGAEDLLPIETWLKANPEPLEGTFAVPVFQQIIANAKAAPNSDIIAIVQSDGEWNDTDKLKPIIAELSKLKNIKAVVVLPVSVKGQYRSQVEAALAPLGSSRVIVANYTDLEMAGSNLRDLLDK